MTTDLEEQANYLCKSCGLCCTSFFSKGYIQNDREKAVVKKFGGKSFTDADGYLCFEQPCPAYEGICSVYPDHPLSCKNYACTLLKLLRNNDINIEYALKIVDEIQSAISQIDETLMPFLGKRNDTIRNYMRIFYKKIEQYDNPKQHKQHYYKALSSHAVYMYLRNKYFD